MSLNCPALDPGSPAARLLWRVWTNSPFGPERLDDDARADLPVVLRHLIERADAAVTIKVRVASLEISAPQLMRTLLTDPLHHELTDIGLAHEYTSGYGARTCDIDSAITRTPYAAATARVLIVASAQECTVEARSLPRDIPLDIVLAGCEVA